MAPRFPRAWVDQVYAASSIVDIVSNYIHLQKKGQRHWGLCPFHNEKTPSFSVNPELNLYYCFGCKASGNIAQFVMEMEKLTYPEALLYLAKTFNLPAPPVLEEDPYEEELRSQRDRLLEATREAAVFYHEQLWLPQNSAVLDYLHKRGLDDAVIRRFGLGASPNEWDSLLNHLLSKGFTPEEAQAAGLVTIRQTSRYDTFRDRAMFPIINRYGQTIGFGARAMGSAQPKYLNTADNAIFNKRYNMYGINLLRRMRNLKQLIVVEGYLDVIAMAQAGIPNVVATLGTALTPEQVRLVKNYAPEIWIAYDGDEPGQMAAHRALDILSQEGVPARVIRFPDQLDPDDFIHQSGAEGFWALKPLQAMAFRLMRLEAQFDMTGEEGKRAFAIDACNELKIIHEPVELDYYLGRISLKTGIAKEVLAQQARQNRTGKASAVQDSVSTRKGSQDDPQVNQSEFMLAALLASGKLPKDLVVQDDFEDERLKGIVQALLEGKLPAAILEDVQDAPTRSLAGRLFNSLPEHDAAAALSAAEDCLYAIRVDKLTQRIRELTEQLKSQDASQKLQTYQLIGELRNELNNQTRQVHLRKEVRSWTPS